MEGNEKRRGELGKIVVSRRQLLRSTGFALATVAVASSAVPGTPLARYVAQAAPVTPAATDIDILNYALSLEHLEAAFYTKVVAEGHLSGNALTILTAIRNHELAHVDTITAVIKQLGGTPVAAQNYNFGDVSTQTKILTLAEALEDTGVGAYTGAAAMITDKTTILPSAASIEQVESRHYAAIRYLNNEIGAPAAFGPSYTMQQVMDKVSPFIAT